MTDIHAWFNHVDRDKSGVSDDMSCRMSGAEHEHSPITVGLGDILLHEPVVLLHDTPIGHIDARELQAALQLGKLNFSLQLCGMWGILKPPQRHHQ